MKTKYIFSAALVLGTLSLCTSCDNWFDEKHMDNGDPQISVVKTYDYMLLQADYKTVADNKTNKAYAFELDSVNGLKNRYQNALARVGENGFFNTVDFRSLAGDVIGNDFRVGRCLKNGAVVFQFLFQLLCVDEVSVMRQTEHASDVIQDKRLSVLRTAVSCGGISDMSYADISFQAFQFFLVEYFIDQAHVLI